jgi:hypothetical protein
MIGRRTAFVALTLVSAAAWCASSVAQDPGKSRDEALDSLIERLAQPDQKNKSASETTAQDKDSKRHSQSKSAGDGAKAKTDSKAKAKAETLQTRKPANQQKPGSGDVSTKDKELDELLEKLGETKDDPAAEDRPRGRPQPGEDPEPPKPSTGGADKSKEKQQERESGLQGKDKEIDERLEEFAGKKRKKSRSEQEQGGGPLSQIIKEMREVEQRLGKPDTSEDTQGKQKRIVKQIETLIEQIRQSGSSGMAMRRIRQPGEKPGNQPGQTPGANARGAPATKPAKPSDRHSLAGGKDVWGHLPEELRLEMDNVFNEEGLEGKQDLIRRYYLSLSKRKLVRGE